MAEERLELLPGQYRSITGDVDAEIVVTRSRFIASLRCASCREEFDLRMREIERLYPKASHHCWAYRFTSGQVEHSSDAGEPAGTAGRPILGALKKHDLLNTMAVVTRYYGGVNLGIKGLISAYGDAVLNAIAQTKIVVVEPQSVVSFTMGYDQYNILLSRLGKYHLAQDALKTNFAEFISGEITVPNSVINQLTGELDSLSANQTLFRFTIA